MPSNDRIFLSYARPDSSYARRLAKHLDSDGLDVFLDEGLTTGSSVTVELMRALRRSDWYVVLLSKRSLVSPSLNFELGAAMAQRKRVIPVLMSRAIRNAVPLNAATVGAINAQGLAPREVAERIRERIGQSRVAAG